MDAPLHAGLLDRLSFDTSGALLPRVLARYEEPHRRYHGLRHILACLDARDRLTRVRSPEVDLALLFHDAVYEPLARDNEARSAALLLAEGRRAWISDPTLLRAAALVHATAHQASEACDSAEAGVVVDADLSILGADDGAFDEYERQVREEYAMVDPAAYAAGRSQVLRHLLARPSIYATRPGQRLWESRARANIERSLSRLGR